MAEIIVRLWGKFAEEQRKRELILNADSLSELRTILHQMLNDNHFSLAVNEEITKEDIPLQNGDKIDVIPPVAGG